MTGSVAHLIRIQCGFQNLQQSGKSAQKAQINKYWKIPNSFDEIVLLGVMMYAKSAGQYDYCTLGVGHWVVT